MSTSQRNITVVTKWFHPQITPRAFRASELVMELCRQGHKVNVWTSEYQQEHAQLKEMYKFNIDYFSPPIMKPIKHRGKGIKGVLRNFLRRFLNLFFQYPDIEWMWKIRNEFSDANSDITISIGAPHAIHWGVAWARGRRKEVAKIWIADCGDPFMGRENDSVGPLFYFKYLERWFCKRANYITVPTEASIQGYYPKFRNKIRVIPQGFKFGKVENQSWSKNDIPTFAYAGGFIPGKRDPRPLLKFLNSLKLDFRFHIYTSQPDLIRDFALESNGRIIVHSKIRREMLFQKLEKMDFLINIENAGKIQTPSKLIDYAISGRPILSINVDESFTGPVTEFLQGEYRQKYVVKDIEQYRVEHVVSKFLCLYEKSGYAFAE